ncbi:MAG: aminotransferase class V-fold PLP-dependent enzyme [Aureisphaera sp.]
MNDLSSLFPVSTEYTYLNTASCGLLSSSLVTWRREHDLQLMKGGSMFRDLHKKHVAEIREEVAQFFYTTPNQVALVPNFSFGLNVLLGGISKGKKVLLLKRDYPSVNWPIENRDFDVCYAELNENLEKNIEAAVQKHRPDILALSIVQYISGIKIDLDFLSDLKRTYPQLTIIGDGTQFLGTTDFNFEKSPFDIVGASAYKWLLSGYGCGLFMIKKGIQENVFLETIGFNSADANFSKRNDIEFVGHLEPGHQDTLNYGSLGESIRFLNSLGRSTIETHLHNLTTKAKNSFLELGLLSEMASQRKNHSTIFNISGDKELFEKMKTEKIVGSLRGQGIRVSFHIYNTEEDLNRLLSLLKG